MNSGTLSADTLAYACASRQPAGFVTRLVEAGFRASIPAGRIGRGIRLPPQFGHMPCNTFSVHSAQKVHS
jgi:hypothetical protein